MTTYLPPFFNQSRRPNYITTEHWEEWVRSGVADEIIRANVRSLSGDTGYDYLLNSDGIPRRNDGRVRDWILGRYAHIERGGWWCSGVKLTKTSPTLWEETQSLWGCFKSDSPYQDKECKIVKYEHPPKAATETFLLTVPSKPRLWLEVLINTKTPIILVEGAKKSGCLLTLGYIAIALPGITGAVRVPKNEQGHRTGKPYLIPEIEAFASPGREIFICFDRDRKPKTIQAVSREIFKLGKLLESKRCKVRIVEWDSSLGKGVDDLVASHGREVFDAAYDSATIFENWLVRHYNRLTYAPNLTVNKRYLGDIEVPKTEKLICLKAPKGTGKTETITQLASEALANGQRVLLISHRVQLTQALCDRIGIQSIYEVKASKQQSKQFGHESEIVAECQGIGLCIDSLHPCSQARFKSSDWKNALVIVDESEQVFWHALNSNTCQSDRVAILRELKQLFTSTLDPNSQGKVILSDADLTDVSIDFVKESAGQSELTAWVCLNEWQPIQGCKIHYYTGQKEQWLINLEQHIKDGGKPLIQLDSQKLKGRFSSSNLETYLHDMFPTKKILRIDRQTLQLKNHPAFGCIAQLNKMLGDYDIVITSPSLETGLSIDIKGHFTSVWALFAGVIPTNSVRQTLARLREPVDRHIWLAPYGLSKIGRGETSVKQLLQSENKIVRANLHLIYDASLDSGEIDVDFLQSAQDCWAKMAVRINAGMINYRDSIVQDLKDEGHRVCEVSNNIDSDDLKTKKTAVTANRDINQIRCGAKLEAAELVTEAEAKKLEDATSLNSEDEQLKLQKYKLHHKYGQVDVTTELYLRDCAEWYPKIRLHYYLTVGNQYLKERDRFKRDELVKDGEGWTPDINRNLLSLQVRLFNFLEFPELLNSKKDSEWKSLDSDLIAFKNRAIGNQGVIRQVLRFSVKDSMTPIQVVRLFLNALGVSLDSAGKRGKRGEQERTYRLKTINDYRMEDAAGMLGHAFALDDGRDMIFERWLERDEAKALKTEAQVATQSPQPENVSKSDTVSTPGKYISIIPSGYQPVDTVSTSDTETEDISQQQKKETNPQANKVAESGWYVGQRVKAWFGVGSAWCDGVILEVGINASRCFKSIVRFTNGAIQYIWDESQLITT